MNLLMEKVKIKTVILYLFFGVVF